ncbi:MAG: siphovirus ReqiPepy6 Gp37-like family protein [Oscillospiraceae bacterium]|jgi:hypothetical protein|nr:siphovirus ReqiPepy6 Gp37-like family protein [Oscillospiraceae bacterium]
MGLWVFDVGANEALGIVERYSTLRASRRYDEPGEIVFTAPLAALDDMSRISPGQVVWPAGCDEAYIIEAVAIARRQGGVELTARGRTLTALLGRRCSPDVTYYAGKAGYVARRMMEDVFGDEARAFPGWSLEAADGLGLTVSYLTSGETLLEAVGSVCRGSGLGMRTVFDPAQCAMRFEMYEGVDRFDADALDPASLDPEFDSLAGLAAEDSVEGFANVMYALGEKDSSSGVARKIVVDSQLEATGARLAGLERFERAARYSGGSVTDGSGSAIGRPPGGGGGSFQLTEAQYQAAMKAFALNALRAGERGVTVSGTVEYAGRAPGSRLLLGDIVRVRARGWGVDTASRVRALEEVFVDGVASRRAVMGAV